jgi:hypothetical protein
MYFFFADDSQQDSPTRVGMRPLVAVGGILLEASHVGQAQRHIDRICTGAGFPKGEEFKWSPGRELWMREGIRGAERQGFFIDVLTALREHGTQAAVVIVDRKAASATGASSPEEDATRIFLERASSAFRPDEGVVIVDRPPGDRAQENRFLADCVEHLLDGNTYAVAELFALPVLSAQSRFMRLLQAADLVASSTLAFVAGEAQYSPPIFAAVKPLLLGQDDRIGGFGLKIHPDLRYGNLYHWLVGDTHFWKRNVGHPLPHAHLSLYHTDSGMPSTDAGT